MPTDEIVLVVFKKKKERKRTLQNVVLHQSELFSCPQIAVKRVNRKQLGC